MGITVIEIARLAGVSIGTVDRALNNRAGINEKTKEKVLDIAREHGYRPNRLSKALSRRRGKKLTFGVITLPPDNPFSQKIIAAAHRAGQELMDFGVSLSIHRQEQLEAQLQVDAIRKLTKQKVDGIAMFGIDEPMVRDAVNHAVDSGIPVVTYNSDIPNSKRLCYVGEEIYRSGQVAADLLCRFMAGQGNVLILHGSHAMPGHQQRVDGFQNIVQSEFPEINVVGIEECHDDEEVSYQKTMEILRSDLRIDGIYIVARAVEGAGRAIMELGKAADVKLVCNDIYPTTAKLVKAGVIDATILQDPEMQGKMPIKILFELIFDGNKPERENYYTKMEIRTKHFFFV